MSTQPGSCSYLYWDCVCVEHMTSWNKCSFSFSFFLSLSLSWESRIGISRHIWFTNKIGNYFIGFCDGLDLLKIFLLILSLIKSWVLDSQTIFVKSSDVFLLRLLFFFESPCSSRFFGNVVPTVFRRNSGEPVGCSTRLSSTIQIKKLLFNNHQNWVSLSRSTFE